MLQSSVCALQSLQAIVAGLSPVQAQCLNGVLRHYAQQHSLPAFVGHKACHAGSSGQRMLLGATQSGKLVVPDWAGPTGSKAVPPSSAPDDSVQQRRSNAPAGPYGYQPDFMDKQTVGGKQQNTASLLRSNGAAQMSVASRAACSSHDGEGGLASWPGLPISRQSSSSALLPRPPSVLGGRLLGVPPLHMPSLHALPENDAYLGSPQSKSLRRTSSILTGPPSSIGSLERESTLDAMLLLPQAKPRSPRRTSSFLTGPPSSTVTRKGSNERESALDAMLLLPGAKPRSPRRTSSFLTGPPSGTVTRKGSNERESMFDATMPLLPQSNVLDASLLEPEILDHASLNLPIEVSRQTTTGSLEAASAPLQGPVPLIQVALLQTSSTFSCDCAFGCLVP